jgi:osmotically-inducible protein OsmY
MRKLTLALLVLVLGLQVGCSNWNRMTPAGLDNTAIQAEVKKNLLGDGLTGIDVDVDGNRVVTLAGHLSTLDQRSTAVHDAEKVNGVRRVVDRISVP